MTDGRTDSQHDLIRQLFRAKAIVYTLNLGKEQRVQPLGDEFGSVVYKYDPKCDLKFITKTLFGESK